MSKAADRAFRKQREKVHAERRQAEEEKRRARLKGFAVAQPRDLLHLP